MGTRKGSICKALNCRKYDWLYTFAFVRPSDGETYWWMFPTVNSEAINETLKKFVEKHNPNRDKKLILLWDRAGFHRGSETKTIEGLELFPLPAYTPELQPVERIWPENASVIQKVTGFYWILSAQRNIN